MKEIHTERVTYSGYENLSKEKRNANWLTCVAMNDDDDTLWVGDNHGQVTSVKEGMTQHKRMASLFIHWTYLAQNNVTMCSLLVSVVVIIYFSHVTSLLLYG